MMAPTICVPRLPFDRDTDYAKGVQVLLALETERRRRGTSTALLLRKASVALSIRSFRTARQAASDALVRDPTSGEAHWLHAMACLGLAAVGFGILGEGAGEAGRCRAMPVDELVREARLGLAASMRLSTEDPETESLLGYLSAATAASRDPSVLRGHLRELLGN